MRTIRLAAVASVLSAGLHGQFASPQAAPVLLVGHFRTTLSYEAVLEKLDAYYQEQIGRKLPAVLPLIAQQTHYEAWHDMWVFFTQEGGSLNVVLKRQTDGATIITAKGWMLQMAGRAVGELPLRFEERPPLRSVESEIAGSRRDVMRALGSQPAIREVASWQYAGLLVAPAPLVRIELARSVPRGTHHLTVHAETVVEARQLAAKLTAAMRGPCVCAAYSETAAIDEEVRKDALEKSEDVNATTARKIYLSSLDPKQIEEKLRAEPEMQKRLASAAGWVGIRYRIDKAYAKVQIRWSELTGYSRGDGKFEAERPVGASSAAGTVGARLTAKTKLSAPIKPGAYRIAIEGMTAAGESVLVDRRDYWFDGKTFEEL